MGQKRVSAIGLTAVGAVLTVGLVSAAAGSGAGPGETRQPAPATAPLSAEDEAFFESKVRPLLAKQCFSCHSSKTKIVQGGLRLDTAEGLHKGGDSGPTVVPGKPDESSLIQAVRFTNPALQMPPGGKMSAAEIQILEDWVKRGAPFPRAKAPAAKPDQKHGPLSIEAGKQFWSIRPLLRAQPPVVKQKAWPTRRIDHYLLARLEAAKVPVSPSADRRTLIRRLSLDLIGLPPTPDEVAAFERDPAPDAYAKLVERLLASPHYGERWGRHWLDLVRYCDVPESWAQTEAQAYLYRDWVVRALNADLPYDQFVKRQLAADQMPEATPKDIAALGFLGLSPSYWKELKLAPDVIKTVVAEEWEERINTVSGALLGLTAACARCHDHKYDPVKQQDYYRLAGVFASVRQTPRPLLPPEEGKRVLAARAQVKALEAEAKRLRETAAKDPAKAESLKQQATDAETKAAEVKRITPHFDAPLAYAVEDASLQVLPDGPDRTKLVYMDDRGQDVALQVRGDPAKAGQMVPRGFLTVLSTGEPARFTQGSGRRELGEAIFRDSAPLAARVIVNRVWKHHFGRGLVETPSNFGTQGDRPSHPELLDDLAARFIAAGWSLKWLHREIVFSSAYRQTSRATPRHLAVDPENRLLGRMSRRRLEVEAWRDSILTAAGKLELKIGGPPQALSSAGNLRRTLYGIVTRRDLDDLLRLYDFPDPTAHSPARFHTTTPLQQLFVLNSEFIGKQATALAQRVRTEVPNDLPGQVKRAHLLLFGRLPTERELATGNAFLAGDGTGKPGDESWQQYVEVLLARNELMFVD